MASQCPTYNVRKAVIEDINSIIALTNEEGWDEYAPSFVHCMFELYPEAWFVAVNDNGDVIGIQALIKYDAELTCGGIYIVQKQYRGLGIGRAIDSAAHGVVGSGNVILSANDVKLYNTRGFTHYFDVYMKRGAPKDLLRILPAKQEMNNMISDYEETMFSELQLYDWTICKYDRTGFFKRWILGSSKHIMFCKNMDGNISGYGCLRKEAYGYQLAPVYANSTEIAFQLIAELLKKVDTTETVDLFIIAPNKSMVDITKQANFINEATLHKMYKQIFASKLQCVFSMSSLEMSVV